MISIDLIVQRIAERGNEILGQLPKDTAEYVTKQRLAQDLIRAAESLTKSEKPGVKAWVKFVTSDGAEFNELQEAEWHETKIELATMLEEDSDLLFSIREGPSPSEIADWIIKNMPILKEKLGE